MKTKKLILTFYVGCIALSVASISMSVAWFATASRLQVSSIDITIDGDRDLLISTSLDGEYKEVLDQAELTNVGEFIPLTSAHSGEWIDKKSDTPVFYDETKYSTYEYASGYSVSETGYFSQKLYLKADDDVWVSIDESKTKLISDENKNRALANRLYTEYQEGDDESLKNLTVDDITKQLNKLANAMRYSILLTDEDDYRYIIIDPNKNDETYLGGLLDNNIDYFYDFYTKESDHASYERVYGELVGDKANLVYDEATDQDSGYEDENEEPNAFNAKHKSGVKLFNYEKSKANGVDFKKEEKIDLKDFAKTSKPVYFPVYQNSPKEVVVSIYIEGWDLDSVNYTMGAAFISNLSFMIEREM